MIATARNYHVPVTRSRQTGLHLLVLFHLVRVQQLNFCALLKQFELLLEHSRALLTPLRRHLHLHGYGSQVYTALLAHVS